jgi:phospholipid/cholesterol/gamma-HCH transport system substrate-binding protein
MFEHLIDSSRQVHRLISDVTEPDQHGMTASVNIRESLKNARTATANLADATEALKHNFLTRGFFKNRGYYTLADMSVDEYRQNRTLANRTARRIWLSASELFQRGASGDEALSATGNELLNSAFADHRDAIPTAPIVVEGYSNDDIAADRLHHSRRRALVVRQYLQTRFELELNNLGAVPMKNIPPGGVGRATWDGICLVLLKRS